MSRVWLRRSLAVLLVLVAAAVPVAFTLARQPDYRASVSVVAVERGPLRPSIDPAYVRDRLAAGSAELATRLERSGIDPGLLRGVAIEPDRRPAGAVAISAAASTPARATQLLELVLLQVDALSAAELERVARRRLRTTELELAAALPGSAERAALVRRRGQLRRYLDEPRARFGALEMTVERPGRWADRLARDLPGAFPARPSPIWAGVAGALVGAALAAAAGLFRRRGRTT
jgi:hypothetical protein